MRGVKKPQMVFKSDPHYEFYLMLNAGVVFRSLLVLFDWIEKIKKKKNCETTKKSRKFKIFHLRLFKPSK